MSKKGKIKLYSYQPKRDSEGDLFYCFWLIPTIEYSFSGSDYGNLRVLYINWIFWELQIKL